MPEPGSSADREPSAAAARGIRWDALAAIIAALVGLLALCVSAYTAYIQRQQVRAQVWPYLLVGNNDSTQSIDVGNKGVGPAIVKTAQVFIDGTPQTTWSNVLAALGLPAHGYSQSTLNPNVLSAGEELQIIRIPDKDRWQAFRVAAVGRMALDVCYCSTLGECWLYHDDHPVGYKSIAQLVHAVDRCPRLPEAEVFNN